MWVFFKIITTIAFKRIGCNKEFLPQNCMFFYGKQNKNAYKNSPVSSLHNYYEHTMKYLDMLRQNVSSAPYYLCTLPIYNESSAFFGSYMSPSDSIRLTKNTGHTNTANYYTALLLKFRNSARYCVTRILGQ